MFGALVFTIGFVLGAAFGAAYILYKLFGDKK